MDIIEADAKARVDAEDAKCNIMAQAIKDREVEIEAKGFEIRKIERQVKDARKGSGVERCVKMLI